MKKLLDRALALIGLQRIAEPVSVPVDEVDKDKLIATMYRRYGSDLDTLKKKWQAECAATGREDGGCGHGLVRFPYEAEFTPCHCGSVPRELMFTGAP